jgi:hypothetical protein
MADLERYPARSGPRGDAPRSEKIRSSSARPVAPYCVVERRRSAAGRQGWVESVSTPHRPPPRLLKRLVARLFRLGTDLRTRCASPAIYSSPPTSNASQ